MSRNVCHHGVEISCNYCGHTERDGSRFCWHETRVIAGLRFDFCSPECRRHFHDLSEQASRDEQQDRRAEIWSMVRVADSEIRAKISGMLREGRSHEEIERTASEDFMKVIVRILVRQAIERVLLEASKDS